MRGKILVAAAVLVVLAIQAAPASAQLIPQRWSMVFFDVGGSLMECVDFGKCTNMGCPAYAFFADKFGRCDQSSDEEFEPGRYRLSSCTWNNIDWSFFAPNTKQVILDVTCSRLGGPFFWFGAMPPFSCAAGVTYKRIDQYGANVTMNEGYGAATIGQRRDCAWVFGPPPELEDLEDFDFRSKMRMRRR